MSQIVLKMAKPHLSLIMDQRQYLALIWLWIKGKFSFSGFLTQHFPNFEAYVWVKKLNEG